MGLCRRTIQRHILAGTLPAYRTPPMTPNGRGGDWRVYEDDIRAFLRQYRKGGHDVPLPESLWQ